MASLEVEIVTQTAVAFQALASEVSAPGFHREFGVLPDHSPFLSVVIPGLVKITTDEGVVCFIVGRGFVEAGPRRVVLLTESCEKPEGIDVKESTEQLEQAERDLAAAEPNTGAWKDANHRAQMARARLAASAL